MNDMNSSMKSNPAARLFPRELPEKRTEYGKVFQLDPKHFQAVTYAVPIHERGQNGAWAEIDRSFHAEAAALHSANARMHVQCQAATPILLSLCRMRTAIRCPTAWKCPGGRACNRGCCWQWPSPPLKPCVQRPLQMDGCVRYAASCPRRSGFARSPAGRLQV